MSHFYDLKGNLVAEVPNLSKGGYRPTTSADAKKLGLVPSVTTVLTALNKEMLNDWRVEQAIKTTLASGYDSEYHWDEGTVAELKEKSENYTRWSADFGTAIHQYISQLFKGMAEVPMSPQGMQALEIAEAFMQRLPGLGLEIDTSEFTFVNPDQGVAGTIDVLGKMHGEPSIVDFKTRQDLATKRPTYYEEQGLQLSGYALGINRPELKRVSVLIDRQDAGIVDIKVWKDVDVAKHDAAWPHLLRYYRAIRGL